ncbi:MAG TPA: FAD binding domain-containing protein [Baekduia sp.]|nr:FAD binding domain-containing protein [Baekduia sp.]
MQYIPPHRPPTPWSGEDRFLTVLQPRTLDDALAARAAHPDATVVAGGTGVLVDLNRGVEPVVLIDLSRVAGLRDATREGDTVRLGAGVTYTDVIEHHVGDLPGLAAAARTVASRQIRNRATLAGALVLGDPSGDALAALGAAEAHVEIRGPRGRRTLAADAFITAQGVCDLQPDELVTALLVPVADGPVAYAKAGARNAMARAVCAVAIALHPAHRTATACVVGAAPTAIRPSVAEALVAASWDALDDPATAERFGALVAAAVDPISDARGSAAYRRHIAGVLAARVLRRAVAEVVVGP